MAQARKAFLKRHPVCELRLVCDGNEATQVDHLTPQSRGGADEPWNWAAARGPCNLAKGDR
jgi:5-methylcytosine-specific restriction endonuclease McrA